MMSASALPWEQRVRQHTPRTGRPVYLFSGTPPRGDRAVLEVEADDPYDL